MNKKSESRTVNSSKNLIFSFILQFSKIFLLFVNRIIFVKILGASFLGINGLFSNVLGLLSLADLGMTTAMMYCLYKPLAINDEKVISQYMNFFKRVYNLIAAVVTIVGVILIPFLKYIVNLPSNMPYIYLYYILLLINTSVSYLFVYQTTLATADQKNYILNKYDIIFQYILFVLQIIILIVTKSFTLYLAINVICTLLCNVIKVNITQKLYPYLKENNNEKLSLNERKKLFTNLGSLFLYKVGSVIQTNTDNILISIFVGTITVGYYSNYNTIIFSITTFLTMIFTSIKASLGNFVVEKSQKEQLVLFNILETLNFILVGFCSVCFIVLIPDFIRICFGNEYVLGNELLIWTVLNFYTSNIRQTLWAFRETTGIFNKTKYITLITSAFNLILSVIFGKIYGLSGIICASVVARMIYAWWREPLITFNIHFKSSPKLYFINYIKRLILISFICVINLYINSLINVGNIYFNFFIKAVVCAFISGVSLLLIYRKSDALIFIKDKLMKRSNSSNE